MVIKLQKKVKDLETQKKKLRQELDRRDDMGDRTWQSEDAFESLKVVYMYITH